LLSRPPDPMVWAPRDPDIVITDPKEALDVFDFEPAAKKNLPPAHFGYMVTGADDEVTLRANREGFLKFQLRPRRLVDVAGEGRMGPLGLIALRHDVHVRTEDQ